MLIRTLTVTTIAIFLASGCANSGDNGARSEKEAETKDVSPRSGLAPCSERLSLVRAPRLDPSQPVEQSLKAQFGAERLLGIEENAAVLPAPDGNGGILRIWYPKGSINFGAAKKGRPLGGAAFYVPFASSDVLCVHYRVRIPEGFEFVKGGKLPGLYGGEAPSGGEEVTGKNGWSVRLMWRKEGVGELYEYVVNKKDDFGLSAGRGTFSFPRGRWTEIDLEVEMNEPGQRNGIARLWIDGKAVIEQSDIIYMTDGDRDIEGGLMFSTFFGGSDSTWESPKDQSIDFADFRMYSEQATR